MSFAVMSATHTSSDVVVTFHQNWSRVVLIYTFLMAVWGLFLWVRGSNPTGGYLGALVLDFGVILVQGVVGIILVAGGHRPHDSLHFLYGFVAVVALPAAYSFSDRGVTRRDSLVLGLGALFLFGIAIRAITTGQGS